MNFPKSVECVKTSTTHCYIVKSNNLEASTFYNSKSSNSGNGAGVGDPLKVSPNCVQIENPANHVNLDDQSVINSLSSQVSQDSKLKVRLRIVPVTVCSSGSDRCCYTYAFLDEGSNTTQCTESLVKNRLERT